MIHRKEEYSRCTFAYERAEHWYGKIKHSIGSGNILTCKATRKFLQARKIYVHYNNEFQLKESIPLTK